MGAELWWFCHGGISSNRNVPGPQMQFSSKGSLPTSYPLLIRNSFYTYHVSPAILPTPVRRTGTEHRGERAKAKPGVAVYLTSRAIVFHQISLWPYGEAFLDPDQPEKVRSETRTQTPDLSGFFCPRCVPPHQVMWWGTGCDSRAEIAFWFHPAPRCACDLCVVSSTRPVPLGRANCEGGWRKKRICHTEVDSCPKSAEIWDTGRVQERDQGCKWHFGCMGLGRQALCSLSTSLDRGNCLIHRPHLSLLRCNRQLTQNSPTWVCFSF